MTLVETPTLGDVMRAMWVSSSFLVPTLPGCVAVLTLALYRWRKYPSFINTFNFKRPFWLVLYISIGMTIIGIAGVVFIPALVIYFDPLGLTCLPFVVLTFVGEFLCAASSFYCLCQLITAILLYIRLKRNDN